MNTETKNKLIPDLRFPKFVNEGGWKYVNGDILFEPISNKNHDSNLPILAITQEQGAIPRSMIDYHVSVTDQSIESYKVVEVGDFIISLRSFQGGIEYSNYKGLCSPAYIILRKKENFSSDFFRHYFKSIPFIRDLNRNLEGIRDGKMVSYKQFSEILLPDPSDTEQQKIAHCLSSLDEVIAAHSQKLEALKEHKKGLMQNLFPQDGETVPKKRFPEFLGDGDWVELLLGEAARFTSGGTPSKDNTEYWNGNIPWISASSMYDLVAEKSELNITNKAVEDGANMTRKGNILILVRGSMLFKRIPICLAGRDVSFNQDVKSLELKKEIDNVFFLYLLISKESDLLESVTSTGIGAGKLDTDGLKNLQIKMPSDKEEQKRVASCLWGLDKFITAQTEKIDQLKLHKKGLMQGLFPKRAEN